MVATNRIAKYVTPDSLGGEPKSFVLDAEPAFRPNWTGLAIVGAFLAGLFVRDILGR